MDTNIEPLKMKYVLVAPMLIEEAGSLYLKLSVVISAYRRHCSNLMGGSHGDYSY